MIRVAINGFGRIGRTTFRVASRRSEIEIVAVNDLGDLENLAYLLKYDTVYGRFDKEVSVEDGISKYLVVDGKRTLLFQEKDPSKLPWKDLDIDIVIESTGAFESYEKASGHIEAGAKQVIISAPAKDEANEGKLGKTTLLGVNELELGNCKVCSNGSCTTNAASPIIAILSENPGIEKALLNTVHGYTATQNLVDGPTKGKDFRRGRSAAQNIVPSSTGAAISVTRVISSLRGLFDGIAMRVPVATGSIVDITFVAKRNTSAEEINDILREAAKDPRWTNVFTAVEDQIVSSDIIGMPYASIADLNFTRVVGGNLVKVLSWYDNEWGYSSILVEEVMRLGRMVKGGRL
jgi:glyceraldehyde 3-phosphate dehydrogenase